MLVDRLLGDFDFSERAPFLSTHLGRACLVILSLALVRWAACRLFRKSENIQTSPNGSRYEIIKTDDTLASNFQFKNHSYRIINRKTANPGWTAIMRFLGNVFIGLLGFYSLANAFNGNVRHVSPRSSVANTSSVLDVFEVYKPVEFVPPSQGCSEVLLLMEYEFANSYGKPFVGKYSISYCSLFWCKRPRLIYQRELHATAV